MARNIRIANIDFNANFFNAYMRNIFGESFAHSSLSFEELFRESKRYGIALDEFISPKNIEYALKLDQGTSDDLKLLQQRFNEVEQALTYFGIPKEKTLNEYGEELPCVSDFSVFIPGAIRPYRNKAEYERALREGKTPGANYESETVIDRTRLLFTIITEKLKADQSARELKKGNNDAFAYALSAGTLSIKDIIEINNLVNNGEGIHEGFKTANNEIPGCPFTPCPKELVPTKMQELLYKYYGEWAEEIPEYIEGLSSEQEKKEHLRAICEREAKFHIEFERIHPFEEGNGRTGRIILNKNLIDNELAPVLITPEMRDVYIKCIDENNSQELGNYFFLLSSVTLTEMISAYRKARGIKPNELSQQEIGKINLPKNLNISKKIK